MQLPRNPHTITGVKAVGSWGLRVRDGGNNTVDIEDVEHVVVHVVIVEKMFEGATACEWGLHGPHRTH